ncbi:MAG: 3D domain-containing protein [Desulfobacterales bacterium]
MKKIAVKAENRGALIFLCLIMLMMISACSSHRVRTMEVTSYCGCGQCCKWERGSWKCLKLDLWNQYISEGPHAGEPYSGKTASGTKPREPRPGLLSVDSIVRPWMIPVRIIFFPWLFMPQDGTIAADTRYYPFGTRMYIPGYGHGVVEDRGSAIKGPDRLDVFYRSHSKALQWGRRKVDVKIYK